MDISGRRAVQRNTSHLYPYNGTGLELSGVILGSPPEPGVQVHRRGGVDILPRPSLRFMKDEIITVYLEIYGLKEDGTSRRRYLERVTVTRTGKEPKGKKGLTDNVKRLAGYGKKSSGSLTLSFEREPAELSGPVAEHFTIDTSLLVPGSYRLKIEVFDRSTGEKKNTGCFFELK
jgi:hypothetical protein